MLAIKILRDQTIPGALNGGNPIVFSTSDEFVPTTVSYENVPSGFNVQGTLVNYFSAGGLQLGLNDWDGSTYLAMPSAAFQAGDFYLFNPEAISSTDIYESVGLEDKTASGGTQSFTFPAAWAYTGPTAAALPTFNFAYTGFSGLSDVSQIAAITYTDSKTRATDFIQELATENYQAGATSFTIPDLSGLTGFPAPPASGEQVNWNAYLWQNSITGSVITLTGDSQLVSNGGIYTVP
jgi:hypothetical protein